MRSILNNKRSQQEIMGFVLIVVIIVVVGVVFLGISLRKAPALNTEDLEISNFLTSSTKYTTDCVLDPPLPADLKEVIGACYAGKTCIDGRLACDVLNKTYLDILNSPNPLKADSDRVIKHNKVLIYYQDDLEDASTKNVIMELESGDPSLCGTNRAGKTIIPKFPGNLIVELSVCS